jgi:peptidoglycan hydrolase-like protein with peptidoglycan-binding domain
MSLQSSSFRGDPKLEAAAVSNPSHIVSGAVGPHVAKIQQALIRLDRALIDSGEMANSRYGPSTAKAVLGYKQKRKIINTSYQNQADDIVGIMTMAALDKDMLQWEQDNPITMRSIVCKVKNDRSPPVET